MKTTQVDELLLIFAKHSDLFETAELHTMHSTLDAIIQALRVTLQQQSTRPENNTAQVIQVFRSGAKGRPSHRIDDAFLRACFGIATDSHIAKILGCSARTVRRRAIQAGLVEAGNPVFIYNANGQRLRQQDTRAKKRYADEELDRLVYEALQQFPSFGRRLLRGHLRSQHPQYLISDVQLRHSLRRVEAVPRIFGNRRIRRRRYQCAGPMAVVHHDGQHSEFLNMLCN